MNKLLYILSVIVAALGMAYFNELGNINSLSFGSMFAFTAIAIVIITSFYRQAMEIKAEYYKGTGTLSVYWRKMQDVISQVSDRNIFILCWIILIVGYFPAYLALFPGTFGYDGPVQVAQYFGDIDLTTHHPIAHTYLMGIFFSIGKALFGSYTVGYAMYTAVQGLIVTAGVAYSILFCLRRKANIIVLAISAIYLILNPFMQLLIFASTKDILFGAFLLFFTTEFANSVIGDKVRVIRLICFGILTCLFRNQGIYILAVLLVLAFIFRVGKKAVYAGLLSAILFTLLFNTTVNHILHIPAGDKREMLCVPMQQVAYVTCEYGSVLTNEQFALVEEVIAMEGIVSYNPTVADNVKSYFNTNELTDNFSEHLKNYIEIGLQNPEKYKQAWEWLIAPYWDVESNAYRGLLVQYTFEDMDRWDIKHEELLQSYYHRLLKSVQDYELAVWKKPEICLWIMLAVIVLAIAKGNKKQFVIVLPILLYFGTALLGPVALVRYLYPVTLATPLLVGMVFLRKTEENV